MFKKVELRQIFGFLDYLQSGGETNMSGTWIYLRASFGLDGQMARRVVGAWMRTYDDELPIEERVAASINLKID